MLIAFKVADVHTPGEVGGGAGLGKQFHAEKKKRTTVLTPLPTPLTPAHHLQKSGWSRGQTDLSHPPVVPEHSWHAATSDFFPQN